MNVKLSHITHLLYIYAFLSHYLTQNLKCTLLKYIFSFLKLWKNNLLNFYVLKNYFSEYQENKML